MLTYKILEDTYLKLIEIIAKTNINYKWIEKETGVSARTIRRWKNGEHKPHPVLFLEFKKVVDRLYDLTFGQVANGT